MAQAGLRPQECEWVELFGRWYRSTGTTSSVINSLTAEQIEVLWRLCGFERRPPIASIQGYDYVFFQVRPGEPPDGQQPVSGGTGGTGGGVLRFSVGDIVYYIPEGQADRWVITDIRDTNPPGTYRIVTITGVERVKDDVPADFLALEQIPDLSRIEDRVAEAEANIRNDVSASEGRLRGEVMAGTGQVSGEVGEVKQTVDAVPTAVAQLVGPLVEQQGDRLALLISGVVAPDISDLLGLVPTLAEFLANPLEFLLAQGGGVSQEVLDSVRS